MSTRKTGDGHCWGGKHREMEPKQVPISWMAGSFVEGWDGSSPKETPPQHIMSKWK